MAVGFSRQLHSRDDIWQYVVSVTSGNLWECTKQSCAGNHKYWIHTGVRITLFLLHTHTLCILKYTKCWYHWAQNIAALSGWNWPMSSVCPHILPSDAECCNDLGYPIQSVPQASQHFCLPSNLYTTCQTCSACQSVFSSPLTVVWVLAWNRTTEMTVDKCFLRLHTCFLQTKKVLGGSTQVPNMLIRLPQGCYTDRPKIRAVTLALSSLTYRTECPSDLTIWLQLECYIDRPKISLSIHQTLLNPLAFTRPGPLRVLSLARSLSLTHTHTHTYTHTHAHTHIPVHCLSPSLPTTVLRKKTTTKSLTHPYLQQLCSLAGA